MKVFINTTFTGHYPVGTASVIIANTPQEAAALLEIKLDLTGLTQEIKAEEMVEISTDTKKAFILIDGNY